MTDRELDQLLKQVLLDAVKLDMEEIAETDALFGPPSATRGRWPQCSGTH